MTAIASWWLVTQALVVLGVLTGEITCRAHGMDPWVQFGAQKQRPYFPTARSVTR